jgi:GTP-binding protein
LKITAIQLSKKIHRKEEIPFHGPREICFVGRSNVGKSSALNTLLGRKVLSPVSKAPGRTRALLYYLINEKFFFVDMPGYGFARRSDEEMERWKELLEAYLSRKDNPRGIVHILDIRHEPSALDRQMFAWLSGSGKPVLFLLTKSDKLSKGKAASRTKQIIRDLPGADEKNVITFSAVTGLGRNEVWGAISGLLRSSSLTEAKRGIND